MRICCSASYDADWCDTELVSALRLAAVDSIPLLKVALTASLILSASHLGRAFDRGVRLSSDTPLLSIHPVLSIPRLLGFVGVHPSRAAASLSARVAPVQACPMSGNTSGALAAGMWCVCVCVYVVTPCGFALPTNGAGSSRPTRGTESSEATHPSPSPPPSTWSQVNGVGEGTVRGG